MSAKNRILLEKILYDMRYDMDCIGEEAEETLRKLKEARSISNREPRMYLYGIHFAEKVRNKW